MAQTTYLTIEDIAKRLGVGVASVRSYHNLASARRRDDSMRPGDLPEPDHYFSRTPVWKEATIRLWESRRPGKGVGGGRPRKNGVPAQPRRRES